MPLYFDGNARPPTYLDAMKSIGFSPLINITAITVLMIHLCIPAIGVFLLLFPLIPDLDRFLTAYYAPDSICSKVLLPWKGRFGMKKVRATQVLSYCFLIASLSRITRFSLPSPSVSIAPPNPLQPEHPQQLACCAGTRRRRIASWAARSLSPLSQVAIRCNKNARNLPSSCNKWPLA